MSTIPDGSQDKAEAILFYSELCPHCPPAKDLLRKISKERDDFVLREVSILTVEGKREADIFNVSSVPTIIIRGPSAEENIGLRGNQGEKVFNKYLDIALGRHPERTREDHNPESKGIKIGKIRLRW